MRAKTRNDVLLALPLISVAIMLLNHRESLAILAQFGEAISWLLGRAIAYLSNAVWLTLNYLDLN
jgi:hypothetical protein